MNAEGKVETLNSLIANEQGFIKWSLIRAAIPFIIGLTASVILWYSKIGVESSDFLNKTAETLNVIPGLLGTAYGAFSLKDYFARKNRITAFNFLKLHYKRLSTVETPDDPELCKEIDERFYGLLDKHLA